MTLKEKLERWRDLQTQADALAEEIRAEVLDLGQTIKAAGVVASYSKGRGSYDYEGLAKSLAPDEEVIQRFTVTRVDWRRVVSALNPSREVKMQFYRPGRPYVSLKITGGGRSDDKSK